MIAETLIVQTATPTSNAPKLLLLPTPSPSLSEGEAEAAIRSALDLLQHAGPMRIHAETTAEDGKTTVVDGEVILPDRFHIVSGDQEILSIGSLAYIQENGQWISLNQNINRQVTGLVENLIDPVEQEISGITLVHAEVLEGIRVHEYQYRAKVRLMGEMVDSTNEMWISDSSGLPIRLEMNASPDGIPTTTWQEIHYDPSIKIEVPSYP